MANGTHRERKDYFDIVFFHSVLLFIAVFCDEETKRTPFVAGKPSRYIFVTIDIDGAFILRALFVIILTQNSF